MWGVHSSASPLSTTESDPQLEESPCDPSSDISDRDVSGAGLGGAVPHTALGEGLS